MDLNRVKEILSSALELKLLAPTNTKYLCCYFKYPELGYTSSIREESPYTLMRDYSGSQSSEVHN
jgi:hypothetical protein